MKYKSIIFLLLLIISVVYAQETQTQKTPTISNKNNEKQAESDFCQDILDENQHIIIPQKGLVLLFFYDPRVQESQIMKPLANKLKLEDQSIVCFQVNTQLDQGLKRTYHILKVPSFVVLQDKRVIYGLNGFTDDLDVLTSSLNIGIQKHLIVSPEK